MSEQYTYSLSRRQWALIIDSLELRVDEFQYGLEHGYHIDDIETTNEMLEDIKDMEKLQSDITNFLKETEEPKDPTTLDEVQDAENHHLYTNFYRCYECGHEWEDVYECQPDDDCPQCGTRHVTPYKSEDYTDG